ncbi:hypothetical protein ABLN97_12005 [Mycobacterium tuberculosis]
MRWGHHPLAVESADDPVPTTMQSVAMREVPGFAGERRDICATNDERSDEVAHPPACGGEVPMTCADDDAERSDEESGAG